MWRIFSISLILVAGCTSGNSGWQIKEIRSKNKIGPEFRHSGTKNTDKERWSVQTGIEVSFNNGVKTGVSYRRRDDNNGGGNNDNGVWWDMSFPLYKAKDKKYSKLMNRIDKLEKEIIKTNK